MAKQNLAPLISIVVFVSLLGWTIFSSLPSNVAYSRDADSRVRPIVTTLMPQSWPFFTKPPSDPEFASYEIVGQSIRSASKFPNNRQENLYGIARGQRAQGPELANLSFQVPSEKWLDCTENPDQVCLERAAESATIDVENKSPLKTLCGNILLVETKPVDFVNRDSYSGWRIDSQIAHLKVTC